MTSRKWPRVLNAGSPSPISTGSRSAMSLKPSRLNPSRVNYNMKTVFSAMRPTGKLHLGHLLGALRNWVDLQDKAQCIYSIADWHALMSEYEQSRKVRGHVVDMVLDWLACGIDPDKSIVYMQSDVPEHLELQMVLACLTPLGW